LRFCEKKGEHLNSEEVKETTMWEKKGWKATNKDIIVPEKT